MERNINSFMQTFSWFRVNDKIRENFAKDCKVFFYQGLDTVLINTLMFARGEVAKRNPDEIRSDIYVLCMWIVMRGTAVHPGAKSLKRTGPDGQAIINGLFLRYQMSKDKGPQANDQITLSRISSTYPHVILGIRITFIKTGDPNGYVKLVGKAPPKLPVALAFPSAAALIPEDSDGDSLYADWLIWAFDFDRVVNTKTGTVNPDQVKMYSNIARSSKNIDDDARRDFCNEAIKLHNLGVSGEHQLLEFARNADDWKKKVKNLTEWV